MVIINTFMDHLLASMALLELRFFVTFIHKVVSKGWNLHNLFAELARVKVLTIFEKMNV